MTTKKPLAAAASLAAIALFLPPGPALAGLGKVSGSVEEDRVRLHAQTASTNLGTYTVHALTLPNGGAVNEFERADGRIFAVTWRAPGRPDLRQLLGDTFSVMQEENTPKARRMRHPLRVNRTELVMQSGGHPGAFWGVAVSPALEPSGFAPSNLR